MDGENRGVTYEFYTQKAQVLARPLLHSLRASLCMVLSLRFLGLLFECSLGVCAKPEIVHTESDNLINHFVILVLCCTILSTRLLQKKFPFWSRPDSQVRKKSGYGREISALKIRA